MNLQELLVIKFNMQMCFKHTTQCFTVYTCSTKRHKAEVITSYDTSFIAIHLQFRPLYFILSYFVLCVLRIKDCIYVKIWLVCCLMHVLPYRLLLLCSTYIYVHNTYMYVHNIMCIYVHIWRQQPWPEPT